MKKSFIALVLWIFTLPAFAENTILVLGDSISAGYGIDPKQGWVALLQQHLEEKNYDYQIINASISGDTTKNGLARLPKALETYKPQITIIELGGNDGLRGIKISIIKRNLSNIIALTKTSHSKVLLLGVRLPPNYGPIYTKDFQQIYLDLAKQDDIQVIPQFLRGVDNNPLLMQKDGIHPTQKAQPVLMDNVWHELEKMLAKN